MPGFQSTRLATEGALEPFLFLYTDDSIQGNPETCNQSSMMLNYEVKNNEDDRIVVTFSLYHDIFSEIAGEIYLPGYDVEVNDLSIYGYGTKTVVIRVIVMAREK